MGAAGDGDGRVEFLDALRGVAILGILPVNAAYFAYPSVLAGAPGYPEGGGVAGAVADLGVRTLFELKFITIFNLLFGVGLAMLRTRTLEPRARWWPAVVRRLVVLGILGCGHALLLWYGDVVAYYALLGLALFWAAGWTPRALRIAAAVGLALPLAVLLALLAAVLSGNDWMTAFVAELSKAEMPDGLHPGWEPGTWTGFVGQMEAWDPDFEIAVYRGDSLLQALVLRATTWVGAAAVAIPYWGPRMAGLMLLGMAWAREGWFLAPSSPEGARRFRRLLVAGLAVGVPLSLGSTLLLVAVPRDPAAHVGAEVLHYVGSLGISAAYAALVARACAARPGNRWIRAVAAVGRTAFSNYLLQSAAMTVLFYGTTVFLGAGLGHFAGVGRPALLGIAAALAAAQVGGSLLWLRAFRMGPVEWAWRAATYLRLPPMRRDGGDRRPKG